jgi:ribosomal subunit interface protein
MMQLPLQITYRHVDRSEALDAAIREKAEKLNEFYPNLMSCRVTVAEERLHKHQGHLFSVHVDVHVPNHEFVVKRDKHEDVFVALRDAFDAAKRKLEDEIRVQRGDVKTHPVEEYGRVVRIMRDERYGFIETPDGREVYFSAANLVTPDFDALEVGAEVQFIEELAAEGRQAKRVSAGKHRVV